MPDLGREFSPVKADCGYRAPLAPRLARPLKGYRTGSIALATEVGLRPCGATARPRRRGATGAHDLNVRATFSASLDSAVRARHLLRMRPRALSLSFFGLTGALQPIWLLGWSTVFGAWRAGYDASHAISELGQQGSANAVAWNVVGFGGSGLLYVLYSIAIAAEFGRGWLYRITVLQALTLSGGGVFSCDPGCAPLMTTWQGWAHTINGLAYFFAATLVPLVAWRAFRHRIKWRSRARVSLAVGVLLVGLFLAGPFLFGADRVGLYQRLTIALAGTWSTMVGLRLWQLSREPGGADQGPDPVPLADATAITAVRRRL